MKKIENINPVIILSEFNEDIVENLYLGVKKSFTDSGIKNISEKKIYVPGAFELPFIAHKVLKNDLENDGNLSFIITLGCVIKGETAHFEYISGACANSISALSTKSHVPIMFGVITTYTREQANDRSQIKFEDTSNRNIGYDVASAAIKTFSSLREI